MRSAFSAYAAAAILITKSTPDCSSEVQIRIFSLIFDDFTDSLRKTLPKINRRNLLKDLRDNAGTNRSAAFTNSETKTFFHSNRLNKNNFHVDVIAGHNHFNAFGKLDSTRNVRRSDEELRSVMVEECGMTAAFVFRKNVNLRFEFRTGFHGAGLRNNLTLFDVGSVDTAEQSAYVIACHSFVQLLVEHFQTGNNGRNGLIDQAYDFGRIANLRNTSFYTTGSNGTTTGNREEGRVSRRRGEE